MLERYQNILVEIDGSKQSYEAFRRALEIAQRDQAKVYAVIIINNSLSLLRTVAINVAYDINIQTNAQSNLDRCRVIAHNTGFQDLHTMILEGRSKATMLRNFIADHDIDLFLAGSKRKQFLDLLFTDSIATKVANFTNCDVSIVK